MTLLFISQRYGIIALCVVRIINPWDMNVSGNLWLGSFFMLTDVLSLSEVPFAARHVNIYDAHAETLSITAAKR